jgi:hypothetical protein
LHPPVERHAVSVGDGLPHPHRRGGTLLDAHAERERELLLHVLREALGHREHQRVASRLHGYDRSLHGHLRRHQRAHAIRRAGQLSRRRGSEARRLREEAREHGLVDARYLQQVGDEVAAVDDLARERLFDLPHGRHPALDDERAQGHGLARTIVG